MNVTKPQRRRCLARGCNKGCNAPKFLCRDHWFQVPEEIRNRVWNAHANGDRAASLRAVRAALGSLREARKMANEELQIGLNTEGAEDDD